MTRTITNDELKAARRDALAFVATEVGALLGKFEQRLSTAWITDQREGSSDAAMRRDWDAADKARAELIDAIKGLQAKAAAAPDLLSIAKRWAALDGGAWDVARQASEKAEVLADTAAAIAKIEGR